MASGIVFAAVIKPQFALLLIAPLVLRRWKATLVTGASLVVAQGVGFVASAGDTTSKISEFIDVNLSRSTETMVY
jgi:hypothetical protein